MSMRLWFIWHGKLVDCFVNGTLKKPAWLFLGALFLISVGCPLMPSLKVSAAEMGHGRKGVGRRFQWSMAFDWEDFALVSMKVGGRSGSSLALRLKIDSELLPVHCYSISCYTLKSWSQDFILFHFECFCHLSLLFLNFFIYFCRNHCFGWMRNTVPPKVQSCNWGFILLSERAWAKPG